MRKKSSAVKKPKTLSAKDKEAYIKHFRVAIFGSARIKETDKVYKEVFEIAKEIGKYRLGMVTGGGPGLMEAANAGHEAGDKENLSDSIGLTIKLPWETRANHHLDIKKHFDRFSARLDQFMLLSNVVIVVPGGIGTCLELFYTWQLIQVKHINKMPIVLYGKMWKALIRWAKKYMVKPGYVYPQDLDCIHIAKNKKQALEIIAEAYRQYRENGINYKFNFDKYKVKI